MGRPKNFSSGTDSARLSTSFYLKYPTSSLEHPHGQVPNRTPASIWRRAPNHMAKYPIGHLLRSGVKHQSLDQVPNRTPAPIWRRAPVTRSSTQSDTCPDLASSTQSHGRVPIRTPCSDRASSIPHGQVPNRTPAPVWRRAPSHTRVPIRTQPRGPARSEDTESAAATARRPLASAPRRSSSFSHSLEGESPCLRFAKCATQTPFRFGFSAGMQRHFANSYHVAEIAGGPSSPPN